MTDNPRCIICGELATRYGVRTGQSVFDGVWFFGWLRRLHSMPPKLKVVEIWDPDQYLYCVPCRADAESVLEEAHARIRAEYARINDEHRRELAVFDHGGLDKILRTRRSDMIASLDAEPGTTEPRRQLTAGQDRQAEAPEVHTMPVASTAERQGT